MASILEGELAQTISDALLDAGIPYDIAILRTTTEENPEQPWNPGETVTTTYTCSGFTEEFSAEFISAGLVQSSDVRVIVLAPTLSITPELSDRVTVRGKTYSIVTISPDPALATIALQARA